MYKKYKNKFILVVAMEQFGLPADQNGFLMSYIGNTINDQHANILILLPTILR